MSTASGVRLPSPGVGSVLGPKIPRPAPDPRRMGDPSPPSSGRRRQSDRQRRCGGGRSQGADVERGFCKPQSYSCRKGACVAPSQSGGGVQGRGGPRARGGVGGGARLGREARDSASALVSAPSALWPESGREGRRDQRGPVNGATSQGRRGRGGGAGPRGARAGGGRVSERQGGRAAEEEEGGTGPGGPGGGGRAAGGAGPPSRLGLNRPPADRPDPQGELAAEAHPCATGAQRLDLLGGAGPVQVRFHPPPTHPPPFLPSRSEATVKEPRNRREK